MVTKVTRDNYISHDGKVSGRRNPLCGASTHKSKVRDSKKAALSLTLPCEVFITQPEDNTITGSSEGKCQIDTHDKPMVKKT
jgi:hypothetical protein